MLIDALSYQGSVGDTRFSVSKAEETRQREELIGCFLQKTLRKKWQVSKTNCDKTLYLTYGRLIVAHVKSKPPRQPSAQTPGPRKPSPHAVALYARWWIILEI